MQTRKEALEELTQILCKQMINVIDINLRSCITCINFKEDVELCDIYKQRPPARIIAKGCESYSNISEDIPF